MIHLDAKTGYSFMRGFGTPNQWYERAKELGENKLGICDYASVWGHVPFAEIFGENLLLGVQIPVCRALEKDPRHGLVSLIAKSDVSVLYSALSLAHEQTYYRPRLTWKQVRGLADDCFILLNECALEDIQYWDDEIGYVALPPRLSLMHRLVDEYKCVATGSPVYPSPGDREGFELVQAISDKGRIGEIGGGGSFLMKKGEYDAALSNIGIASQDKWFANAEEIAASCTATISRSSLPKIDGPSLEVLTVQGAKNRKINIRSGPYADRLAREFEVIGSQGFEDYFLMVADVVSWAKQRMLVGPGRGSSGGSLVCYLLGITEVDPLVHNTLFERFLDPGRSDLPDIDIDFPDTRREEVFEYLRNKYGAARVARLGTVSKFGGKSAINDTCRAYNIPYTVMRDVAKAYEDGPLSEFFRNPPDHIKGTLDEYPLIAQAALLEDHPRHSGVHAAGVCISADDVHRYGSLDRNGIISLDLKNAEQVGMLKLDALGLRTLSLLQDCCLLTGTSDLYRLRTDDPHVYSVCNEDRVTGVFQFEGHAVRQLMKQMPVEYFDDLCALTSLARPGPLYGGAADLYIKRRSGEESIPGEIHPCTESTFGLIIFQEQAMQIVKDVGGLDDAEVNAFRKAVGKKDPAALATYAQYFVGKEDLWDEICEFGGYAFNKSHAVAYSLLSYYCAYFKAHHPLEFALAQLRNGMDEDKAKDLLRELEADGHEFIPFDPHISESTWSIQDGKLIGGFDSVKGIGKKTAEKMVSLRTHKLWLLDLTDSQRKKVTADYNTPWDDLSRMRKKYANIYDDCRSHRSSALPSGIVGPVMRIADLPGSKGTYTFLGRLKKRQLRETNGEFCNLFFEDDTGEVGCTIARRKWPGFKWLLEEEYDGADFVVKGTKVRRRRCSLWSWTRKSRRCSRSSTTSKQQSRATWRWCKQTQSRRWRNASRRGVRLGARSLRSTTSISAPMPTR
jgi:DNA polymerase III alpha subunit